jgi:mevalonate kinase
MDFSSDEERDLYALIMITMGMFYDNDHKITKEELRFLDEVIVTSYLGSSIEGESIAKELQKKRFKREKVRSILINMGISSEQCSILIDRLKPKAKMLAEPKYLEYLSKLKSEYNF